MEEKDTLHALAYFNLLKTGNWIETIVKDALKPFNLTHAQLNALHVLNENDPDPVSANDLKQKLLVASPDVTRLLDRLVKKGYVVRQTCPNNRRMIDINISKSGKALLSQTHNSLKVALGDFFKDKITEEEAGELRRILHKIRD